MPASESKTDAEKLAGQLFDCLLKREQTSSDRIAEILQVDKLLVPPELCALYHYFLHLAALAFLKDAESVTNLVLMGLVGVFDEVGYGGEEFLKMLKSRVARYPTRPSEKGINVAPACAEFASILDSPEKNNSEAIQVICDDVTEFGEEVTAIIKTSDFFAKQKKTREAKDENSEEIATVADHTSLVAELTEKLFVFITMQSDRAAPQLARMLDVEEELVGPELRAYYASIALGNVLLLLETPDPVRDELLGWLMAYHEKEGYGGREFARLLKTRHEDYWQSISQAHKEWIELTSRKFATLVGSSRANDRRALTELSLGYIKFTEAVRDIIRSCELPLSPIRFT